MKAMFFKGSYLPLISFDSKIAGLESYQSNFLYRFLSFLFICLFEKILNVFIKKRILIYLFFNLFSVLFHGYY